MGQSATAQEARLNFIRGSYWLTNPVPEDFTLSRDGAEQAAPVEAAKNQDLQNSKTRLTLYRLADPTLLAQIISARAMRSLSEGELLRRVAETIPIWQGDLVSADRSRMQVPLEAAAGTLPPGVYVLTASPAAAPEQKTAQWFVKTKLSIKTAFVDSRAFIATFDSESRKAYQGIQVQWCDSSGALIDKPVSIPESGSLILTPPERAAVLIATDQAGHGEFGTVVVPPLDQRLHLDSAMIYPSAALYQPGKPFSFLVTALGEPPVFALNKIAIDAQRLVPGVWQIDVPRDLRNDLQLDVSRAGQLLNSSRVAADMDRQYTVQWLSQPKTISSLATTMLKLRVLKNGKAAANISGAWSLRATARKAETPFTVAFTTDNAGLAVITLQPGIAMPEPGTYQPQITIAGGVVALEKQASISIYPADRWLAITPQFSDNAVPENVTAQFKVQIKQANGAARAVTVAYTLARETYKFEWYQDTDGRWTYRTKTSLETVQTGQAEPAALPADAAVISVPINAGRYRLSVHELNGTLEAEHSFTAGWWLTQQAPATPEKIELNAKTEGDSGDQAKIAIFVDPPFAANVWVAAFNSASGATPALASVADEGGFVYVPRSDLQPGQPLTLIAYGFSNDPSKPLVQAEGTITMPLGRKLIAQLDPATNNKGSLPTLRITGLPVDQPLDKNIAQGIAAISDDATQQLLATIPLTIDTAGAATVPLPKEAAASPRLQLRIFTTYSDRLDVSEQTITMSPKSPPIKRVK